MSSSPLHYSASSEPSNNNPLSSQVPHNSQISQVSQDNSQIGSKRKSPSNSASELPSLPSQKYSQSENLLHTKVWGTDLNVSQCMSDFEEFLCKFKEKDSSEPKYLDSLAEIEETQIYTLNLKASDIHSFHRHLYHQLISYPQEILPLFDTVVNQEYRKRYPEDPSPAQIAIKIFGLLKSKKMRDIDPDDIDCLISFTAMATRSSEVLPDIKVGFFRCSMCRHEEEVAVDRGRIAQPKQCNNSACKSKDSYGLIHNRCVYSDKQLLRGQETPQDIPEGETPQTVDMFCYDDLIDIAKPGDIIQVTGIYRAIPTRVNRSHRNIKALYRSYIDVIHLKKTSKTPFLPTPSYNPSKFIQIAKDPAIYQKLVNSLAPSIWQLDDVKKGILCQLFGGVKKPLPSPRSQINILLCGDPGTSKSQLLSHVHSLSPRGIYTSGKGSSAVGLTASVNRDPETHQTVLNSGALVLSDNGICCIDEFDKMSDSARTILHEAMEQQTISIAKAGIICTLNARTCILAAANPRHSRYDRKLSVIENLKLPPSLLSRFDLIYLILDQAIPALDKKLARHLIGLYSLEEDTVEKDFFPKELLAQYLEYAVENCFPKLSEKASVRLVEGYLALRRSGKEYRGRKVVAATPRQLESLIRISEALARMKLKNEVEEEEVEEALRLVKVATRSSATDPRTGVINMDLIAIGKTALEKREQEMDSEVAMEILERRGKEKMSVLLKEFLKKSGKEMSAGKFREMIMEMERKKFVRIQNLKGDEEEVVMCDF